MTSKTFGEERPWWNNAFISHVGFVLQQERPIWKSESSMEALAEILSYVEMRKGVCSQARSRNQTNGKNVSINRWRYQERYLPLGMVPDIQSSNNKKSRAINNPACLNVIWIILIILVLVFYRFRFSYLYQTFVQEYVEYTRIDAFQCLNVFLHYLVICGSFNIIF